MLYGMDWRLPSVAIRRYSLRTDGFVSVHSGYGGGAFTTPPFTYRGGEIEGVVGWTGQPDLAAHAGHPVRLRVELRDADLFAFRFR